MEFEDFLERALMRSLPDDNPLLRMQIIARELAAGAAYGFWRGTFILDYDDYFGNGWVFPKIRVNPEFRDIETYMEKRFPDYYANLELLISLGYLKEISKNRIAITQKAFALLDEPDPSPIFISYKRAESSAFALLIEYRLSQAGMLPFLDKQLQAGDDWHAELESKIKDSDYFVILLGHETLKSDVTVKEIQWALEADIAIIPIWHNGFEYKTGTWKNIPVAVDEALANTHTIRVLEENPLTYDTALQELLNRFGIVTV